MAMIWGLFPAGPVGRGQVRDGLRDTRTSMKYQPSSTGEPLITQEESSSLCAGPQCHSGINNAPLNWEPGCPIYICFSLFDLLHSLRQTLGPSTFVQMTQILFPFIANIPLHVT